MNVVHYAALTVGYAVLTVWALTLGATAMWLARGYVNRRPEPPAATHPDYWLVDLSSVQDELARRWDAIQCEEILAETERLEADRRRHPSSQDPGE